MPNWQNPDQGVALGYPVAVWLFAVAVFLGMNESSLIPRSRTISISSVPNSLGFTRR